MESRRPRRPRACTIRALQATQTLFLSSRSGRLLAARDLPRCVRRTNRWRLVGPPLALSDVEGPSPASRRAIRVLQVMQTLPCHPEAAVCWPRGTCRVVCATTPGRVWKPAAQGTCSSSREFPTFDAKAQRRRNQDKKSLRLRVSASRPRSACPHLYFQDLC
jgi:hypothetical protein